MDDSPAEDWYSKVIRTWYRYDDCEYCNLSAEHKVTAYKVLVFRLPILGWPFKMNIYWKCERCGHVNKEEDYLFPMAIRDYFLKKELEERHATTNK